MKNKEIKKKELSELVSFFSFEKKDNNNAIYLVNISHLNSNQISILRKNFREENIKMKVVKNTLLKKVLEKNEKFNPFISVLNGNTTILYSKNKGNIISKIIKDFHIEEKSEKPYLKCAYFQESFYFGNKDLDFLMNIKSKEDLIMDILNILQFPMRYILLSLNSLNNNICSILEALIMIKKIKK
ncbi:50S ribosomal protein L10 [Blattabacterium cuenoti]|uniref:50S ribosomal protein L10 n=1 Tax=Blattabacterium cuenoti TaxID=1653831 RepID=UPI00163C02BF|nr:50S ribosomal protein L10 [Blattabacterium cuenoti]